MVPLTILTPKLPYSVVYPLVQKAKSYFPTSLSRLRKALETYCLNSSQTCTFINAIQMFCLDQLRLFHCGTLMQEQNRVSTPPSLGSKSIVNQLKTDWRLTKSASKVEFFDRNVGNVKKYHNDTVYCWRSYAFMTHERARCCVVWCCVVWCCVVGSCVVDAVLFGAVLC